MVTLCAFSTQAEAALAKSVLDDHNITSALADENSYLYGGAPMAMPVRLLVAEEQAAEAARILETGGRDFPDVEGLVHEDVTEEERANRNPWELLAISSLIALPAIALMLQTHDLILVAPHRIHPSVMGTTWRISRRAISVVSAANAHLLGAFVLAAALSLAALFFYLRRRQTSR
jgi:hypothetical protein